MSKAVPAQFPAFSAAANFAAIWTIVLWLGMLGLPASSSAQAPASVQPASSASAPASRTSAPRGAVSAAKPNGKQSTKPLWAELTPAQKQALAPLSAKWDTISEPQKRKWLALSQNYPKMSGAEQDKLHSRMSEWATLSPQQRTQARLNFGETRQLSPDDKKAKWEAYQALPPEEKRKLAAAAAAKPPAAAAAVKPVPANKLASVPKRAVAKGHRIAAAPEHADRTASPAEPAQAPAPAVVN